MWRGPPTAVSASVTPRASTTSCRTPRPAHSNPPSRRSDTGTPRGSPTCHDHQGAALYQLQQRRKRGGWGLDWGGGCVPHARQPQETLRKGRGTNTQRERITEQSGGQRGPLQSGQPGRSNHVAPCRPDRTLAQRSAGPAAAPRAGPYFRTPPSGKTFSPTVASTPSQSLRLSLGRTILTGGTNSLPLVKTLQAEEEQR